MNSSRLVHSISFVTAPFITCNSSGKSSSVSWYCSSQYLVDFSSLYHPWFKLQKVISKFCFSFSKWLAENYHMVQFTPWRRFQYTTKYKNTWYSTNSKVSLSVSLHLVILITPLQDCSGVVVGETTQLEKLPPVLILHKINTGGSFSNQFYWLH